MAIPTTSMPRTDSRTPNPCHVGRAATASRLALGLLFVASALLKALAPADFARQIAFYGVPAGAAARVLAAIVCAGEAALGAHLLTRRSRAGLATAAGLLVTFSALVAYGWLYRGLGDCGCFGPYLPVTPPWALAKNAALIALAAAAWRGTRASNGGGTAAASAAPTSLGSALSPGASDTACTPPEPIAQKTARIASPREPSAPTAPHPTIAFSPHEWLPHPGVGTADAPPTPATHATADSSPQRGSDPKRGGIESPLPPRERPAPRPARSHIPARTLLAPALAALTVATLAIALGALHPAPAASDALAHIRFDTTRGPVDLGRDTALVALLSETCPTCAETVEYLNALAGNNDLPPVVTLVLGDNAAASRFRAKYAPHFAVAPLAPAPFFDLIGSAPPRLLLLHAGHPVAHWDRPLPDALTIIEAILPTGAARS